MTHPYRGVTLSPSPAEAVVTASEEQQHHDWLVILGVWIYSYHDAVHQAVHQAVHDSAHKAVHEVFHGAAHKAVHKAV